MLTLHRWSFAGQNEPIPGHGSLEGVFEYSRRISPVTSVPRRLSYDGQNEPIPGFGHPNNNDPATGAHLVGCVLLISSVDSAVCSVLTRDPRLEELPQYSPFDTWEGEVSRGYNPVTDFLFNLDPNRGMPGRNA